MKFNIETYKRKVFKTISRYKLVEGKDKIFIGLSGGKDSGSAAHLLSEYLKENKINAELIGFYIKLGDFIPEKVIDIISKQAEICEIELKIYDIKEFGIDYEKIAKLPRPICSSCGTIKRYLMNKIPREEKATKLCTGHHGDDFIVFFIKNLIGGNIFWISKFSPLLLGENKQLTRIRPLFFVGGDENRKYCDEIGFPYIDEDICPHTFLKQKIDIRREKWYQTVREISEWQPNFRENFLKGVLLIAKEISKTSIKPYECEICGEPTNTKICAFCRLMELQNKND